MRIPHSRRSGIHWPAMPAFVDAMVLALQYQLEQSQWWPAETLAEHQLRQLELLLVHTARTVPFYRGRLKALAGLGRGELTMDAWRRLPVLRRTDIQEAGAALIIIGAAWPGCLRPWGGIDWSPARHHGSDP